MEEQRFTELATDYTRWVKQACRQKFVGDDLMKNINEAWLKYLQLNNQFEAQTPEFVNRLQIWGALAEHRALAYGLAIENACKARLIYDGAIESDGEKIKGLRTDHNIEAMAQQLGVSSPADDPEFLKLLTYQTQVLAKYPIAKNRTKQKEFTGRSIGATEKDGRSTLTVIIQVLKHQELIDLYHSFEKI